MTRRRGSIALAVAGAVLGMWVNSSWPTDVKNTVRRSDPVPPGDVRVLVAGHSPTDSRRSVGIPRSWWPTPLPFGFSGSGDPPVSLLALELDRDGFAQHTGWVASDDALLALDRNGNGRIDDITEVFGNRAVNGFTELAALDSNVDGTIDATDERFADLLLWRDLNANGGSEAGELQSLADGGVTTMDLNAANSDTTLAGHRIGHTSSFGHTDGTTGTIVDAWFENDRHISIWRPGDGFALHQDVMAWPSLRGYGVVPSLPVAMTLDAGLRQRVRDLIVDSDTLSVGDFRVRVEAMVLDWTGADGTDPGSRGPGMDARFHSNPNRGGPAKAPCAQARTSGSASKQGRSGSHGSGPAFASGRSAAGDAAGRAGCSRFVPV